MPRRRVRSSFNKMAPFLRIVMAIPSLIATCRRILEQGLPLPGGGEYQFETYESNCAYALRYMVDREIVGCNWLSLPAGKWRWALRDYPEGNPPLE